MPKNARGDLNGFLDDGSHIMGELHFEDAFKVSGKITGSIVSKGGDLEIYDHGEIDGEVRVHHALVSGTVRGTLRAAKVEITPAGKVMADVYTPSLVIREGAFFEGRCFMRTDARPESSEREKVAQITLAKPR
ncbi:MAG TPA: polymer-forming cytoskeletal protein [Thermoanaerobaculia bacterium]|jgi:cytoskeletal protein CcmA (bactofilin family)